MTAHLTPTTRQLINEIIRVEGDYVDHPDDKGGPTKYGITEAVARANGYMGDMRDLPESKAREIYAQQYYVGPGFHRVATRSQAIADELTDTGVNMGPTDAVKFLQRALNALNQRGTYYADIKVDGYIGSQTLAALDGYLNRRGKEGEQVMLKALNCLQGAEYVRLTEVRERNESFVYGWLRHRVAL